MSNNPLVNEKSGIFRKMKKYNNGKNSEMKSIGAIEWYLLGINNAINICAKASACCWDKQIPEGFDNVAEYVAKRSRTGHTSILEHSNMVLYLKIDDTYTEALMEFLDSVNYLNTKVFKIKNNESNSWRMVIGGSYRGYSDLYREASDLKNPILMVITSCLYTYAHSAAFEDIINLGLLEKSRFFNVEPDENFNLLNSLDSEYDHELFKVLGMDSIKKIYTNLYKIDPEAAKAISTFDLIKFATITIMFKNMSRTCTHQLVRHRNAITQESQRYVDYSTACFNSPEIFKPDKYDKDHKYKIRFGPSSQMNLTLSEIGEAICGIYSMLSNPSITGQEYHLLKEDARAFLPSNVQCKKIYMTYTFKNFLKFLNLREDKHAQAEIRMYATAVGEWFRSVSEFNTKEICDLYTNPRLLIVDPFNIDVDEGIVEEEIEITEDDYIKAAGLDADDSTEGSDDSNIDNK